MCLGVVSMQLVLDIPTRSDELLCIVVQNYAAAFIRKFYFGMFTNIVEGFREQRYHIN